MIPEGQECFMPMFCNGKPLWGQFFVRDPATGKVTTKCKYEAKRARARLDVMNVEYKLIAHELAEELKIIPTAVSPTARDATSTATDIPGDASTIVPAVKPGAATSTMGDVSTTVEASTATSTHRDIPTTNPTEITTTFSTTVEDTSVIGRIGSTNGVCPPSTAWGPASTMCPSTPREVTITNANYRNDVSTSVEEKSSTKADHTGENDVTDKDSFSAALTSTEPHVLSTKDLTTSPTAEITTKVSCDITFNGICYWTHVEDERNVYFTRAEEICSNKSSTPAHFPSERVYNAVVEDLRSKIPSGRSVVQVWTGVIFDPNTGNVIHPSGDTYVKWYPGYPLTGSGRKTYTRVLLQVNSDPGSAGQGMWNHYPQYSCYGVVCQIVE